MSKTSGRRVRSQQAGGERRTIEQSHGLPNSRRSWARTARIFANCCGTTDAVGKQPIRSHVKLVKTFLTASLLLVCVGVVTLTAQTAPAGSSSYVPQRVFDTRRAV